MEDKPTTPHEWTEAGMEAGDAGSKAWVESAKPRMKAAHTSMETSESAVKVPNATDGLAEHSAIIDAMSAVTVAFTMDIRISPPPKPAPKGKTPSRQGSSPAGPAELGHAADRLSSITI